ncbi:MAG: LysE family translocator [Anaerolineae bacterium]|nr:LysE family translocator [Anaerolineae bacterium]
MIEFSTFLPFLLASLALIVAPGPAVLYIVTRSIDQGRKAGLASVMGVGLGNFVHVLAAAFGVSALLASSALAFSLVKYLGAAYLIYLGLRTLFRRIPHTEQTAPPPQPLNRILRQGIIVATFNPKTALFFLAFLPQFVNPARGPIAFQMLFLGVTFVTIAIASDSLYAVLAGTTSQWLRGNLRFLRVQRYLSGGLYIALGLVAATSGSSNSK